MPGLWIAVVFSLLAVIPARPASADPASANPENPDATTTGRARELFLQAAEALAQGDLVAAEKLFRASHELEARTSTTFNLALVLHERGQLLEAIGLYERVLAHSDEELPKDRASILLLLGRARGDLGQLRLRTSAPVEVEAWIDGKRAGTLKYLAPLHVAVDPGLHDILIRRGDESLAERSVLVAAGESSAIEFGHLADSLAPESGSAAPETVPGLATAAKEPEGEGSSAAIWWIAGSGVVVAGATIAFFLLRDARAEPHDEGPVPSTTALAGPWAW